ncbi:MAG: PP2C family serine/threonine-protein phosphatase [Lysobacterales bacterium]
MLATLRLEAAFCTHKGNCAQQQDAIWIGDAVHQRDNLLPRVVPVGPETLFAIADGVASGPAAAKASKLAVQALAASLKAQPEGSFDGLVAARHVRAVQQRLCEALAAGRLAYGASTTIVAVHVRGDRTAVVNSGDSRAYLLRHGGDIERLSRDHSERQRMIDEGCASADIEYASVYSALSDCLVADPEAGDFAVHRTTATLRAGDCLILCSDGVHDVLKEAEWLDGLVQLREPLRQVTEIRQKVLKKGAPDNFSVIAISATSAV